jgi:uncharacterized protein YciW
MSLQACLGNGVEACDGGYSAKLCAIEPHPSSRQAVRPEQGPASSHSLQHVLAYATSLAVPDLIFRRAFVASHANATVNAASNGARET